MRAEVADHGARSRNEHAVPAAEVRLGQTQKSGRADGKSAVSLSCHKQASTESQ
jgi:hypothetical protein